jgi:hypothetical protein
LECQGNKRNYEKPLAFLSQWKIIFKLKSVT